MKCESCKYFKKQRYNEENLCEYEYQVNGGWAQNIPKDGGKLCGHYKEVKK